MTPHFPPEKQERKSWIKEPWEGCLRRKTKFGFEYVKSDLLVGQRMGIWKEQPIPYREFKWEGIQIAEVYLKEQVIYFAWSLILKQWETKIHKLFLVFKLWLQI